MRGMTEYAPLVETLVAFFKAVDESHREQAKDPEVRRRIHEALDAVLDGQAKFRIDGRGESAAPPAPDEAETPPGDAGPPRSG